jgi:hypothetical protein
MLVSSSEAVEWKIWNFVLIVVEYQVYNEITFCKKAVKLGEMLYEPALLLTSLLGHFEAANDMFSC